MTKSTCVSAPAHHLRLGKRFLWLAGLLAALVLSGLPVPADALSNDLRHLLNSIGRNIKANQRAIL
jgi:hypothetical protein